MTDATILFRDALQAVYGQLDWLPVADGSINRFHVPGDKSGTLNGWYVLHLGGIASGAFGSWKAGGASTWCSRDPVDAREATQTREREARGKLSWRLLTLSSGERSLSEHAAISGNAAHAGAELRMVDVNAGTRTHRAFDELHGLEGADFHRQLTVAVGAHHGHLGPAFVEKLLESDDRAGLLEDFAGVRVSFVEDNAQAGRVADRFAVIALAGEMATAYGLLPWEPGTAIADCRLLYGEWLSRVGSGNAEDRQILTGILDFIDRHGSSRFSDVDDQTPDTKVFNRAGYWELTGNNRLYLFNKPALIEAAHGYGLSRIIKALEGANVLARRDNERKTKNYRLPGGGQARLYVIDPEIIDREGGGV